MVEDIPFYARSILETWDWLVNVPYLGFVLLVLLGLIIIGNVTYSVIGRNNPVRGKVWNNVF